MRKPKTPSAEAPNLRPLADTGSLEELLKDFLRSNQPLAAAIRDILAGNDDPCQPCAATPLEDWLDTQNVERLLRISPRTLQTLRSNGTIPFSRVGAKLYYKRSDIQQVLEDKYTMRRLHNPDGYGDYRQKGGRA